MLSLDLKALNEKNAAAAEQREQAVQASLARLLASENIHVEFKKARTACFNVASRVLTIPLYSKDLKPEVVAMNVAHEVGHAIWTPAQGWFEHIDKHGVMFKDYLNVVEDIRINKLIKRKYPGVIRDFHIGYRDLYDNEFYGSKEKISSTLSTMYMVDRINLYGKVGEIVGDFAFTAEERALMDRAEKNETFEEVIALALDVLAYDKRLIASRKESVDEMMKELDRLLHQDTVETDRDDEDDGLDEPYATVPNEDAEKNDLSDMDDEGSDEKEVKSMADEGEETAAGDSAGDSDDDEGDDEGDDDEDELLSSGRGDGGEKKDDSEQQDVHHEDHSDDEETTPHSFTEEQYQNNENKLLDASSRDVIYLECPNVPKLSTFLIPSRFVSAAFERVVKESSEYYNIENKNEEFQNRVSKFIRKFNDKHQRYITHLVREFEMRRNAEQFARSLESKTGALNLNKMHQYKFSDDLFKRITIVSKGKNHGMLMFIDASGSMAEIIYHVVEQAAVMASFCRRVNIPFKVITFTTTYNKTSKSERFFGYTFEKYSDPNEGNYNISRVRFDTDLIALELLSDNMSLTKFNAALYCIVEKFYTLQQNEIIEMGGTPLNDIILALPQFVNAFRQNNGVEKVVAMYLTDGDGYGSVQYSYGVHPDAAKNILFIKSPFSSKIYEVESVKGWNYSNIFDEKCYTKTLLKMVKDTTGAELIGYHVASGRVASKLLREYRPYCTQDVEEMKTDFRRNLFMSIDNFGYDEYFIMWDKVFRNRDLTLDGVTKKTSVKGMATAFTDMQNSKMVNRVFLTKFATVIS